MVSLVFKLLILFVHCFIIFMFLRFCICITSLLNRRKKSTQSMNVGCKVKKFEGSCIKSSIDREFKLALLFSSQTIPPLKSDSQRIATLHLRLSYLSVAHILQVLKETLLGKKLYYDLRSIMPQIYTLGSGKLKSCFYGNECKTREVSNCTD